MEHAVYLDHNATTPIRPEAAEAVSAHLGCAGNPSSVHRYGRIARRTVEEARGRVARLVGAEGADVIFTSGGTEANNLALSAGGRILVSAIEHDSVLRPADGAGTIPVSADGIVDLQALDAMLADGADLVSVMLANNETGVVQPVADVAIMARRHGALVHCDAVQAAGKIPIDWRALGVHMLSLSAHKLGGPGGVGALVVESSLSIEPMLRGGGQEGRRRAGTENVAGIAGFGVAAELAGNGLELYAGLAAMRDLLERRLARLAPGANFFRRLRPPPAQHQLPGGTRPGQRDPGDGPRPGWRGGERGLGVFVGEGEREPRARSHGRGEGVGGHPGEPGLEQQRDGYRQVSRLLGRPPCPCRQGPGPVGRRLKKGL